MWELILRSLPTPEHVISSVITGAIVFVCLWPFRRLLGFAEHQTAAEIKKRRVERRQAIRNHVYDGHPESLRVCGAGTCAVLSSADVSS